jgi:hypothetical protein
VPGPIVHLIVQQRLAAALQREAQGDKLASLLFAAQCDPYAAFGSMGPDYLFFSLKEYGTPLDELTHFIFGAYDALRPLIDFYEDSIEPIVDDVEDAIDAVDDALFGGLFQQLKATSALASGTLQTAVAAGLTSGVDLFYPFYPKIQAGAAESDWYWFDFLHYRRTGEFCSTMWKLAGDDDLRRYCLGYASHIAVDVVGHPFVNTIVGGPYVRIHGRGCAPPSPRSAHDAAREAKPYAQKGGQTLRGEPRPGMIGAACRPFRNLISSTPTAFRRRSLPFASTGTSATSPPSATTGFCSPPGTSPTSACRSARPATTS